MVDFQNLEHAFAYYTECQLATVEGMELKKSTSKSELSRQRTIAYNMVEQCKLFHVKAIHFGYKSTPRLYKILQPIE